MASIYIIYIYNLQGMREIEDPSLQGVRLDPLTSEIEGDVNTTRLSVYHLLLI